MVKLQKPAWVFMNGGLQPWDEATLHVSTEAVLRGLNVFEGLKGYWTDPVEKFGIIEMAAHFKRLQQSAKLLQIPCEYDFKEFSEACSTLVSALLTPEQDMWIRATLFAVEGHWGIDTKSDLVMTAFHQSKSKPEPISIGVSTWQRSSDISLPARIKTGTNYQIGRLARIEGRKNGHAEMILLNSSGRVAEATGSCILMVRDGVIITPPASEGRLESITLKAVLDIARSLGIEVTERPIERTELAIADELAIAGTLAELVPVHKIDDHALPSNRPIFDAVSKNFWSVVRGSESHPSIDLTYINTNPQ